MESRPHSISSSCCFVASWSSTKTRRLLAPVVLGWQVKAAPVYRTPVANGDFVFAFHDGEEIGPKMLSFSWLQRHRTPAVEWTRRQGRLTTRSSGPWVIVGRVWPRQGGRGRPLN